MIYRLPSSLMKLQMIIDSPHVSLRLPELTTTIVDENQKAIARIIKVLYVRKKRSDKF